MKAALFLSSRHPLFTSVIGCHLERKDYYLEMEEQFFDNLLKWKLNFSSLFFDDWWSGNKLFTLVMGSFG